MLKHTRATTHISLALLLCAMHTVTYGALEQCKSPDPEWEDVEDSPASRVKYLTEEDAAEVTMHSPQRPSPRSVSTLQHVLSEIRTRASITLPTITNSAVSSTVETVSMPKPQPIFPLRVEQSCSREAKQESDTTELFTSMANSFSRWFSCCEERDKS